MTAATARAQELAERFEQVNEAVIGTVAACDDAAWGSVCHDEGWPVAFTAWHIGDGHATIMGLIGAVAAGQPAPPVTAALLDAANAANAGRHAQCPKADALALLRENGDAVAAAIRALSDEQLDRTAAIELAGGQSLSVQQLIEAVLTGHAGQHLASIHAAV